MKVHLSLLVFIQFSLIFTTIGQSSLGVSSTCDRHHTVLTRNGTYVPLNQRDSTGQLPPKQRDPKVLVAFTRRDPNNYLQVKGPTSYLFNCLHREGPNNCLQVKGPHLICSYSFMIRMLIYSCMDILERLVHMLHILLSNILACMNFMCMTYK